ncbi:MAG: hypothetical protein ACYS0E_19480 [Planctomycetota bacterium]
MAQADPEREAWNPGPVASSHRPVAGPAKPLVGQRLQAHGGNRWWAARIVVLRGDRVRIHSVGSASSWNESVEPSRTRLR